MSTPDVIELEHVYAHPPAAVWRALTTPELHARWWAAGDVRPVIGHEFQLDMGRWGKQPCVVLAVEHERLLSYRFAVGSLDTTVTWRLFPEPQGTRLRLRHEGFNLDTPMGRQALEGMRVGWPTVLGRLEKHWTGSLHLEVRATEAVCRMCRPGPLAVQARAGPPSRTA